MAEPQKKKTKVNQTFFVQDVSKKEAEVTAPPPRLKGKFYSIRINTNQTIQVIAIEDFRLVVEQFYADFEDFLTWHLDPSGDPNSLIQINVRHGLEVGDIYHKLHSHTELEILYTGWCSIDFPKIHAWFVDRGFGGWHCHLKGKTGGARFRQLAYAFKNGNYFSGDN